MAKTKTKKPTKASKLNLVIARIHQLSMRLIGIQMTSGTLIGICLSACQITAGMLVIGSEFINGNPLLILLVVVGGCSIAIMIERLSLGGLGGTRVMRGDLQKARDVYYGRLRRENREATEAEKIELAGTEKRLKRSVGVSVTFGIVGMVLSFVLGDIFWHQIFAKANGVGWVFSSACSMVISLTFIHSELFKPIVDRLVREIFQDLAVMKAAVAAEGQIMQVDVLAAAFDDVREREDVREKAQEKVARTVAKSLSTVADQYAAIEGQYTIYEERELAGGAQKALPAPKGKYVHNRDELLRLLATNPLMSAAMIAAHFKVSKSTAHAWLQKVRVP